MEKNRELLWMRINFSSTHEKCSAGAERVPRTGRATEPSTSSGGVGGVFLEGKREDGN